ncbi:YciI family protein [Risungbinella massiliensis]|uniref:YciI family protein n=1 Tax=Risungbinella massiliensis TaxID=1329796 RepID=UPI0005CB972E|nr:YciI family protein [Risungbinella massiliensis]
MSLLVKEGDKSDKTGDGSKFESLTLRPGGDYNISPEKRFYIGVFSEIKSMDGNNQNLINQHLAYHRSLWNEGTLVFAGSFVKGDRALLVIAAESIEKAGEIIKRDPIFQAGYYGKVDVEEVRGFDPKTL